MLLVLHFADGDDGMITPWVFLLLFAGVTLRWAGQRPQPGVRELAMGGVFLAALGLFLLGHVGMVWPVLVVLGLWITVEETQERKLANEPAA